MKAKSVIKIILDIVMTLLFAVLLFAYSTGLAFHEIVGLSILFLFGLHLILNRQWIAGISKKLFSGQVKRKTLLMYLSNTGILVGVLVITVTGLMISTLILPQGTYNPSLVFAHKWTAYITAGLMMVHLALHAGYMVTSMKKIATNLKTTPVRRVFSGAFVAVLIVGVVYYNVISGLSINTGVTNSTDVLSSSTDTNNQSTQNSEVIAPSTSKKDEEDETITSSESEPAPISLSEFLGKMFCTLCPKHCPLSKPQCGKAALLIAQAKEDYQRLYGDASSQATVHKDLYNQLHYESSQDSLGRFVRSSVIDTSKPNGSERTVFSAEAGYDVMNNVNRLACSAGGRSVISTYTYDKDDLPMNHSMAEGMRKQEYKLKNPGIC